MKHCTLISIALRCHLKLTEYFDKPYLCSVDPLLIGTFLPSSLEDNARTYRLHFENCDDFSRKCRHEEIVLCPPFLRASFKLVQKRTFMNISLFDAERRDTSPLFSLQYFRIGKYKVWGKMTPPSPLSLQLYLVNSSRRRRTPRRQHDLQGACGETAFRPTQMLLHERPCSEFIKRCLTIA